MLCIREEFCQRRAGPRGDDIKRLRLSLFNPLVVDADCDLHPISNSLKKFAFLGGRFEQGDRHSALEQKCQDQSRKPCPATQIHQGFGFRGIGRAS